MNNSFKRLFKSKKTTLIVSLIVLMLIVTLAFFLNRKRANGLFDGETIIGTETIQLETFSSFDVTTDLLVKLFVDTNGEYVFIDNDNIILHKTKDNIEYFRLLKDGSIVYLASSLNVANNKDIVEVKLIDTLSNSVKVLHTGEKLFLEVVDDTVYIIDGLSGNVMYGTVDNLVSYSLNKPVSKVIENKGRVFAVNYTSINNTVRSIIYLLEDDTPEEVCIVEGKVQDISVDYNNDNLIYFSSKQFNSNDNSDLVVYSKYLIDLSASETGFKKYTNLSHNIISIKDKYITIDKTDNSIVLLNSNFTKSKTIGYLHENMISALLKESPSGEFLYYINKSGQLDKL